MVSGMRNWNLEEVMLKTKIMKHGRSKLVFTVHIKVTPEKNWSPWMKEEKIKHN